MEKLDLSPGQARAVAAIRARAPGAQLTFHARPWGYVVEVRAARDGGPPRTVALARFDRDGAVRRDVRVGSPGVGA